MSNNKNNKYENNNELENIQINEICVKKVSMRYNIKICCNIVFFFHRYGSIYNLIYILCIHGVLLIIRLVRRTGRYMLEINPDSMIA